MKKLFLSWDGSDKGKARVLAAPGSRAGVGEGEGEAKAEQVAVDEMEIDGTEVGERMQEAFGPLPFLPALTIHFLPRHLTTLTSTLRAEGLTTPSLGARVAELGCGTGTTTLLLLADPVVQHVRELKAFDASPGKLAVAKLRVGMHVSFASDPAGTESKSQSQSKESKTGTNKATTRDQKKETKFLDVSFRLFDLSEAVNSFSLGGVNWPNAVVCTNAIHEWRLEEFFRLVRKSLGSTGLLLLAGPHEEFLRREFAACLAPTASGGGDGEGEGEAAEDEGGDDEMLVDADHNSTDMENHDPNIYILRRRKSWKAKQKRKVVYPHSIMEISDMAKKEGFELIDEVEIHTLDDGHVGLLGEQASRRGGGLGQTSGGVGCGDIRGHGGRETGVKCSRGDF